MLQLINNRCIFLSSWLLLAMLLSLSSCKMESHVDSDKSDNYYYSKDKTKILYGEHIRLFSWHNSFKDVPADLSSFETLSTYFAKDNKHIFFKYRIIKEADYATFIWDEENELGKDKKHVYVFGGKGKPDEYTIVKDADPATYNNVDLKISCLKWYEDKNHYFYNHKITNADKATMCFHAPFFPFDKQYLFYVENKELKQLKYKGKITIIDYNMVRDDEKIYYTVACDSAIRKINYNDINTFRYYDEQHYVFRIDRLIYIYGIPVIAKDLDPTSFEIIEPPYSKDKNNVYYGYQPLDGADPATFEILNDTYAKDKKQVYSKGKVLKSFDPATFTKDDWGRYPADKEYGQAPKHSSGGGSWDFDD